MSFLVFNSSIMITLQEVHSQDEQSLGLRTPGQIEWQRGEYENTQRVKSVNMIDVISPVAMGEEVWRVWEHAQGLYEQPLVQVRGIVPVDDEGQLHAITQELSVAAESSSGRSNISGRIPFQIDGQAFGLYYMDIASQARRTYRDDNWMSHHQAIERGIQKRERFEQRPVPSGFRVAALEIAQGRLLDILTSSDMDLDPEALAAEIAELHRVSFAYPHDPAQQTAEGAFAIMSANPTLVAFDPDMRVASVGYLEQDTRFSFAGMRLIEPTYFTHPGEQYRRHGLSSHLRQATQQLVRHGYNSETYNGDPLIIFNESIRNTSFPLCIANGCRIAGTYDGSISGNLGDAYTAIGPANPEIGYMPMGLTYISDPRIELQLPGSY